MSIKAGNDPTGPIRGTHWPVCHRTAPALRPAEARPNDQHRMRFAAPCRHRHVRWEAPMSGKPGCNPGQSENRLHQSPRCCSHRVQQLNAADITVLLFRLVGLLLSDTVRGSLFNSAGLCFLTHHCLQTKQKACALRRPFSAGLDDHTQPNQLTFPLLRSCMAETILRLPSFTSVAITSLFSMIILAASRAFWSATF